ncbi:hypothetical protein [Streptomyces sp. NPDC097981]|uniref:hypothetical protein n=1 Tax=Streptomyces sp. NPDC097981 TaxID=3155428 RepID=UPI00331C906D
MIIFRCRRCRTALTTAVREVPPPPESQTWAPYEAPVEPCPPRMAPGTFARDPEPSRFSWPAAPKGFRPPRGTAGPQQGVVLSPGDIRGVEPIERRRTGCCGPMGIDGPNLACAGCGAEVAVEAADCCTWQEIVLDPRFAEPVDAQDGPAGDPDAGGPDVSRRAGDGP